MPTECPMSDVLVREKKDKYDLNLDVPEAASSSVRTIASTDLRKLPPCSDVSYSSGFKCDSSVTRMFLISLNILLITSMSFKTVCAVE
jgi:hypothetical protein